MLLTRLCRALDVRPAEARAVFTTFAGLFFIVVAHSLLETARDAMFLASVGPGALGYMYITTAVVTFAVGALSARLGARIGVRPTLQGAQVASAVGAAAFYFLPRTEPALVCLYAFSAISGAVLVPQLWLITTSLFHVGQGRRLFRLIALAGVLGAVVGSSLAALLLTGLEVRSLLLASAATFALSSAAISLAPPGRPGDRSDKDKASGSWLAALRGEPVLARLSVVVALGAATSVLVDYLFKAVASANVPPDQLGSFFARYYLAINLLALLAQLLASRSILARTGVIGTVGVLPGWMLVGSITGLISGGALFAVIGTKAVEGALRHSVHRTGLELVYLAVPSKVRNLVRPVIDGALPRLAQTGAAGLLLVLGFAGLTAPREVAAVAVLLAMCWSAATAWLHKPYVELFRKALVGPYQFEARSPEELNLASVELLVETLASERPKEVIAAIDALTRRGRGGLVPALLLLRQEQDVLELALSVLGPSGRADWLHLAEKLVSDKRERVRRAAMRALARARQAAPSRKPIAADSSERPWTRGYLAVSAVVLGEPQATQLKLLGDEADEREARLGVLTGLHDAQPAPELASFLCALALRSAPFDCETRVLIARAAAKQQATALLPRLTRDLVHRDSRSETVAALVALGQPAYEWVAGQLLDAGTPRAVRIHLPIAVAEMGRVEGAALLLQFVRKGVDGRVRFRCLGGLERMVATHVLRLNFRDVRDLIERELSEHFRVLNIADAFGPPPARGDSAHEETRRFLLTTLEDKRWQAVGRTCQLLKLCFPAEDFHRIYDALRDPDAVVRGNAIEFLDALLATGPQRGRDAVLVRTLLRCVVEELPTSERLARASSIIELPALKSLEAAITLLRRNDPGALGALAHELESERIAAGVTLAQEREPEPDLGHQLSSVPA